MKHIKAFFQAYNAWKKYNKNLDERKNMTDRELRDIGLSRSDIFIVAVNKSI